MNVPHLLLQKMKKNQTLSAEDDKYPAVDAGEQEQQVCGADASKTAASLLAMFA
jgi:hypothetical protein